MEQRNRTVRGAKVEILRPKGRTRLPRPAPVAIALLVSLSLPSAARADSVCWVANGIAAVSLPTAVTVTDLAAAPDGAGGFYLAWSDNRNGTYDIYLSRFNANGAPVAGWPYQGLPVCTSAGDQRAPSVASDNAGGVYVAWEDRFTATRGAYLQRYAANATSAWSGCVALRTGAPQTAIALSVDGTGAVFATWRDEGDIFNKALYDQKFAAANGAALWTAGGRYFTNLGYYSDGSRLVPDGQGGAFLCWQQGNAGSIMLQRLAATDGAPVWYTWPYPGNFAAANYRPEAVSDGAGGVWVSGEIWRSPPGTYDIAVARYDADGQNIAFAEYASSTTDEYGAHIAPDGSGGVVMAWSEVTGTTSYLAAYTHLHADGSSCVAGGRVTLPASAGLYTTSTAFAGDGHGGGLVVWDKDGDIFAQHCGADGTLGTPLTLCNAPGSQGALQNPIATPTGSGTAVAVWPDPRSGYDNQAFAQCVSFTPATAPIGLTDLQITQVASRGLTAHWTVPNNQPTYGAADSFEVRYAPGPITEAGFKGATLVGVFPAWGGPGTAMCQMIDFINRCTWYWVAIKTYYECGGWSLISNTPNAKTLCSGNSLTDCDMLSLRPVGPGDAVIDDAPAQLELKGLALAPGATRRGIEFGIPRDLAGAPLDLSIFDVSGRRLRTFEHGAARAGNHRIDWDLRDQQGVALPRGVFFLRLQVGDRALSRSFIVLR